MTNIEIEYDLIKKYNIHGPRYTSYPSVIQFSDADDEILDRFEEDLRKRQLALNDISLYFHIPFCFSLCWYCGCTKVITKEQARGDTYIDYLEKEIKYRCRYLNSEITVSHIHFGGGTPTFLSSEQLLRMGSLIKDHFRISEETEFSVEIDPRTCKLDHIAALRTIGCTRASLGIQDTNPDVQQAIHRTQPFQQVRNVTAWLRRAGIDSINFDLIYGLPRQTISTFEKTMKRVLTLQPERLAVYSYAHVPHIMPSQKLLEINRLPTASEKITMFKTAAGHLRENGYKYIGMDHFAVQDDSLAEALEKGTLRRNFQGYSTDMDTNIMAFGMSAISQLGPWYLQNDKNLAGYYSKLDRHNPAFTKVKKLSNDDLIRRDLIERIMCRQFISIKAFEKDWNIDFKSYFSSELNSLVPLVNDGLLTLDPNGLSITDRGRYFLRNIAMKFDKYLNINIENRSYSKTI